MSEHYEPVESTVGAGRRTARPARSTVLFAVVVALAVLVVAAYQTSSRTPSSPPLAAGATAAPTATPEPTASSKPAKDWAKAWAKAWGGNGQGSRMGRDIQVTAISGNQVSLATDDGWKRTITVTPTTTITKGGQEVAVGAIEVGDTVRFAQRRNDDGTYTVTAVHVRLEKVAGEVTAKTSSSITLKRRDGSTVTVHVDGDTTYRSRGKDGATSSLADIAVGDRVEARGTLRADGSLDAQHIQGRKAKVKPTATPGA